jgi:hypothetical protein
MTVRREPPADPVTPETVEQLRRNGASADLVAFADHHAVRYSRHDMDHAVRMGMTIGSLLCLLSGLAVAAIVVVIGLLA